MKIVYRVWQSGPASQGDCVCGPDGIELGIFANEKAAQRAIKEHRRFDDAPEGTIWSSASGLDYTIEPILLYGY